MLLLRPRTVTLTTSTYLRSLLSPRIRAMSSVHSLAQAGFGTGTNELYDRARPSYQAPALAHIRQSAPSDGPLNIVELGAGTGIFTRALLAHPDWSSGVKELRAVEPSAGMRDVFTKTVNSDLVSVHDGSFTEVKAVSDGWADIIIIAQAYHWCHPNYDQASAEFARILKPNGVVAFIWNLEDRDRTKWVANLRNRIEIHEAGTPQFRLGLWRQTFDTPSYQKFFQPPKENKWDYEIPGTLELALDRALSKSYIAVLSEEEKAKAVEDVKAIVLQGEEMVWIDKEKGVFEYPYQTFVVIANKK